MHRDKRVCQGNTEILSSKLESLGFVINKDKSVFIPSQRILYFGFLLDSVLFMVFLTEKKILNIEKMASQLLQKKNV